MRPQIVCLFKPKVIAIDALLPLLMELRERYPSAIMSLVFPGRVASYDLVLNNVHIRKAVDGLNARIIVLSETSRLRRWLGYIRVLAGLLFRRNVIVKTRDPFPLYTKAMPLIRCLSRTVEIRESLYSRTAEGFRNSM